MCGVQHSIVDINHRFVYNDRWRSIDSFMCFFFSHFILIWSRRLLEKCFRNRIGKLDALPIILMFWCWLIVCRWWHRAQYCYCYFSWFELVSKTCYDIVDLPSEINYHPTAMLQINCFLMWKNGDDFTLIAIHTGASLHIWWWWWWWWSI